MSAVTNTAGKHEFTIDERVRSMARHVRRSNGEIEKLQDDLAVAKDRARRAEQVARRAEQAAHRARQKAVAAESARKKAERARPDPPARSGHLAFNKMGAAQALGVSVDFFDEHIAPDLKCVRRGRRRLYALREIERWLAESSEPRPGPRAERWQ